MATPLAHSFRLRPLVAGATTVLLVGLAGTRADAIPAFARKYQTSCQTCHIAYPKLNPFGEAFRLLGYRMPDETEDMVKEEPVQLGAPGYKRLWPDTVWPSSIPGNLPVSLDLTLSSHTRRMTEEGEVETIKNDFRFPEEVGLIAGGTLGETLSFFGEVAFEPEVEGGQASVEIEFEHAQLNFNGPFGWGPAFNLKVGRFAPEVTQLISHSHVLTTGGPASFVQFVPIAPEGGAEIGGHGAAGIALPHSVDGLEVYGILGHRFLYSGGFANGLGPGAESFDGNEAKDVFARVAYKVGGLAYDGSGYVPSDKNWRERSLSLGAFAYRGDGANIFFPVAAHAEEEEAGHGEPAPVEEGGRLVEDRTFVRAGFDVNLFLDDLNLMAGYVRGRDRLAEYEVEHAGPALHEVGNFVYHTWFAQGDVVIKPWLHGALRYEWLRPAREHAPDVKRVVPHLTALIRANVKAYLEYQRNLGDSDDYLLLASVRFAF